MNFDSQYVLSFIIIVWLIVLSYLVLKIYLGFKSIFKNSKDQSITSVISRLVSDRDVSDKEISSLLARVSTLEESTLNHIQRIGLIRFNPFQDTGGEQSFVLALLDTKNSGVVISGLYSRSGMRWYIKKIKNGKGIEHELSGEEMKAIENAK